MTVRMTTTLLWFGHEYHSGDEVSLPDDVALRYIQTGQAEAVDEQPIESAAMNSAKNKGRKYGRV